MIHSITIKNVASYNEATLEDLKKNKFDLWFEWSRQNYFVKLFKR